MGRVETAQLKNLISQAGRRNGGYSDQLCLSTFPSTLFPITSLNEYLTVNLLTKDQFLAWALNLTSVLENQCKVVSYTVSVLKYF